MVEEYQKLCVMCCDILKDRTLGEIPCLPRWNPAPAKAEVVAAAKIGTAAVVEATVAPAADAGVPIPEVVVAVAEAAAPIPALHASCSYHCGPFIHEQLAARQSHWQHYLFAERCKYFFQKNRQLTSLSTMYIFPLPSLILFVIASQSDNWSGKQRKDLRNSYKLGITRLDGLLFELFHLFLVKLNLSQFEF